MNENLTYEQKRVYYSFEKTIKNKLRNRIEMTNIPEYWELQTFMLTCNLSFFQQAKVLTKSYYAQKDEYEKEIKRLKSAKHFKTASYVQLDSLKFTFNEYQKHFKQ